MHLHEDTLLTSLVSKEMFSSVGISSLLLHEAVRPFTLMLFWRAGRTVGFAPAAGVEGVSGGTAVAAPFGGSVGGVRAVSPAAGMLTEVTSTGSSECLIFLNPSHGDSRKIPSLAIFLSSFLPAKRKNRTSV